MLLRVGLCDDSAHESRHQLRGHASQSNQQNAPQIMTVRRRYRSKRQERSSRVFTVFAGTNSLIYGKWINAKARHTSSVLLWSCFYGLKSWVFRTALTPEAGLFCMKTYCTVEHQSQPELRLNWYRSWITLSRYTTMCQKPFIDGADDLVLTTSSFALQHVSMINA